MTRQIQYAESFSTSSGSATVDKVDLKFTSNNGDAWLMLSSCQVQCVAPSTMTVDFYDNIDQNHLFLEQKIIPMADTDYYSCCQVGTYIVDTTPNGVDVSLFFSPPGSPNTGSIREASIVAIKADPADFYTTGSNSGSTTSTSYTPIVSLGTITVPTTGDYWIIATAQVVKTDTTDNCAVRLNVDSTGYFDMDTRMTSTAVGVGQPWVGSDKFNLTAGSHTISIDAKVTTSGTATIVTGNIFVIRLDTFASSFEDQSSGTTTTTSTTYVDKLTSTHTPTSNKYLIFGNAFITRGNTTAGTSAKTILNDGSSIGECSNVPKVGGAFYAHSGMIYYTPDAGSNTWKIQFKKDTGGSGIGTSSIKNSSIMGLEIPISSVNILGGTILGATIL